MAVRPGARDDTPVATIRPIARGEIAGVDDLVDFTGRERRGRASGGGVGGGSCAGPCSLLLAGRRRLLRGHPRAGVPHRAQRRGAAQPVDAIVVLGAAQYDGEPSPQLAARLDHAVTLFQQGVAPLIVVTGGKQPDDRFTEAASSATTSSNAGVPSVGDHPWRTPAARPTSRWRASPSCSTAAGLRPRAPRHRPVPLAALAPHRRGRRPHGLRVADAELGHPRRQLAAPPPARGRRRRPRPDHRLRPPLTPADLGGLAPSRSGGPSPGSGSLAAQIDTPAVVVAGTVFDRSGGEWCNWQHGRFWFCS